MLLLVIPIYFIVGAAGTYATIFGDITTGANNTVALQHAVSLIYQAYQTQSVPTTFHSWGIAGVCLYALILVTYFGAKLTCIVRDCTSVVDRARANNEFEMGIVPPSRPPPEDIEIQRSEYGPQRALL